ncbi:hypothetical protein [Rhizobium sp. L1K21]|uniref:hypothetical protein n=1 Tax=Rhizobium sp. L1K21 TaxID=2954933 RepID=UPI0020930B20|nr:hypothetical protein [Rhizobium sp. L1K21]MCO6187831.1 hypothetical protein [Rhizobium sp. L1K21]
MEIDLIGPVSPSGLDDANLSLQTTLGCLIDLQEDPEITVEVVEKLEAVAIPFLFISIEGDQNGRYANYELNSRADDIALIFEALVHQNDSGLRH